MVGLGPLTSLKRDSGTGVFLWVLQISKNTFYRTPLVAASGYNYWRLLCQIINSQIFLCFFFCCLIFLLFLLLLLSFSILLFLLSHLLSYCYYCHYHDCFYLHIYRCITPKEVSYLVCSFGFIRKKYDRLIDWPINWLIEIGSICLICFNCIDTAASLHLVLSNEFPHSLLSLTSNILFCAWL